ncbi:hypothetical protein JGK42_003591 [Aeromonas veronii]|nr:hypothetical protein [Aeromonas veronii]
MTKSITGYGKLLLHLWQENLYIELMELSVKPAVSKCQLVARVGHCS